MEKIRLLLSGDFAPLIHKDELNYEHFDEIKPILENSDLHITNLECPLTGSDNPIEKTGPSIKSNTESIGLLNQARVDIACLANNHIFDYAEKGILDTIDTLVNNNIEHIGLVNDPGRKEHWLIKVVKGKKFGFVNYCEHEFSVRYPGSLGASGYDSINAYYDINTLKKSVDYVIVLYHGGNEYYPLPRPDLKKDFHYLADLGADMVVGHHTHVISGYEFYNGKPLIYSLGNFFFPYKGEPDSWYQGILCLIEINEKINVKLINIIQCRNNMNVSQPSSAEETALNERLIELSQIIEDDNALLEKWNDFVIQNANGIRNNLLFPGKFERLGFKLGILKPRVRRVLSMNNILKCASLRNLLIDSLKEDIWKKK